MGAQTQPLPTPSQARGLKSLLASRCSPAGHFPSAWDSKLGLGRSTETKRSVPLRDGEAAGFLLRAVTHPSSVPSPCRASMAAPAPSPPEGAGQQLLGNKGQITWSFLAAATGGSRAGATSSGPWAPGRTSRTCAAQKALCSTLGRALNQESAGLPSGSRGAGPMLASLAAMALALDAGPGPGGDTADTHRPMETAAPPQGAHATTLDSPPFTHSRPRFFMTNKHAESRLCAPAALQQQGCGRL